MTEFAIYVMAVVDLAALGLAALVLAILRAIKGLRTGCLALRAHRARARAARRARLDQDPTVILQRLDAEFPHITPQYINQLANSYLIPGEDFR